MIAAVVLAAGQSRRMGRPKMLLPWDESTVLGKVIDVLKSAGLDDIIVISGGERQAVEQIAVSSGARTIYNPEYAIGEMLSSLQAGLRAMKDEVQATLLALGDQPQIELGTVNRILEEYSRTRAPLIVPSFGMRRGHPWLIGREMWKAIQQMHPPQTPRNFLNEHASEIHYIETSNASILEDLDTPDDYQKAQP